MQETRENRSSTGLPDAKSEIDQIFSQNRPKPTISKNKSSKESTKAKRPVMFQKLTNFITYFTTGFPKICKSQIGGGLDEFEEEISTEIPRRRRKCSVLLAFTPILYWQSSKQPAKPKLAPEFFQNRPDPPKFFCSMLRPKKPTEGQTDQFTDQGLKIQPSLVGNANKIDFLIFSQNRPDPPKISGVPTKKSTKDQTDQFTDRGLKNQPRLVGNQPVWQPWG
jgi:hypothetical protein